MSIEDLKEDRVTQEKLKTELQNHGHPQTRIMPLDQGGRQRSKNEAIQELLSHYEFFHRDQVLKNKLNKKHRVYCKL